jgi:hypothetical protein
MKEDDNLYYECKNCDIICYCIGSGYKNGDYKKCIVCGEECRLRLGHIPTSFYCTASG